MRKKTGKGLYHKQVQGDSTLLAPGIKVLSERTQRPVIGVVPYIKGLRLPDEDSVALEADFTPAVTNEAAVVIVVIKAAAYIQLH